MSSWRTRPRGKPSAASRVLDDDDLIRVRDGHVDIAYPFSGVPTPFVARWPAGQERYACCAVKALGMAPMLDQVLDIRSRCHHYFGGLLRGTI